MQEQTYGLMNGHLIGYAMKEMVRRAIEVIRLQRTAFEAQVKQGYDGKMNDVLTSADIAAQAVYVKMIREGFPKFGIIAEEDHLSVECIDKELGDIYFTVDPLDGTKAFTRKQSHGVGTMIALVHNGEVIAAYVGDVNTREIYGYRPGSKKVHRISDYGNAEELRPGVLAFQEENALLRELPQAHSRAISNLLRRIDVGPKNVEIASGSIGVSMARLWKNEVGMAVLRPGFETPWDKTPVLGISKKLGFEFYEPTDDGEMLQLCQPPVPKQTYKSTKDLVIVHRRHREHMQRCFVENVI